MTAELDSLPAFWMRRSRRARQGLRKFQMHIEASPPVEERRKKGRLWLLLAFLSAALGMLFLGQGLWIKAKAELAQILLERAFTQSIATGQPVKPWSWADTWPVARISVPRHRAPWRQRTGARLRARPSRQDAQGRRARYSRFCRASRYAFPFLERSQDRR